MDPGLERRAALHAALSDPHRLAIVEDLAVTDRSPSVIGRRLGLATNLVAHHLDVLAAAGLVERFTSSGDQRRRYVRLRPGPLAELGLATARPPDAVRPGGAVLVVGTVLFVCTHNSARSQLAAALWAERTGGPARSAGTHPADQVHPGAVAAAARAGLDLSTATPRLLTAADPAEQVVTVCDRAHEELEPGPDWWHWSIPDPVAAGTRRAFDAVVADLDARITALA